MIHQSDFPHPPPLLRFLIAFLLLVTSSYCFRPQAGIGDVVLGVVFLCVAYYLLARPRQRWAFLRPSFERLETPPIRFGWLLLGVVCLALLTESNAHVLNIPFLMVVPMHIQLAFLLGGSVGLWRALCHAEARGNESAYLISLWLFCIAFVLRFWGIDTLVSAPVADEYSWAGAAMAIHDTDVFPILQPFDRGYAFPWLYPYFIANSFWLFGKSITSLRLISVILGALTIPAAYWLGREMLNHRLGLWGALLLASFPPHIHLSRLALNNVADPLFGVLCLFFLMRGWRYGRVSDWACAGIALGWTQFFYEGGRLLYPALVAFGGIFALSPLRRPFVWRLALPFLALATPVYITLLASGYHVAPRLAWVAPSSDQYQTIVATTEDRNLLPENDVLRFIGVLGHFVHRLDNSYEFYGGPQPMILTPIQPIFLLGLYVLLRQYQYPSARLLLVWLALAILGISLIKIGAWTARYVVIFPLLCFIISIGIYECVERLGARRWVNLWGGVLCAVICIIHIVYYFGPHLEVYNQQIRPYRDYADAYQRALAYPNDSQVYFITDDLVWEPYLRVIGAMADKSLPITIQTPQQLDETWLTRLSPTRGYIFLVPNGDWETINRILRYFPMVGPYLSPYRVPLERQYALLYLPPK